jgi:hypothetical protein
MLLLEAACESKNPYSVTMQDITSWAVKQGGCVVLRHGAKTLPVAICEVTCYVAKLQNLSGCEVMNNGMIYCPTDHR